MCTDGVYLQLESYERDMLGIWSDGKELLIFISKGASTHSGLTLKKTLLVLSVVLIAFVYFRHARAYFSERKTPPIRTSRMRFLSLLLLSDDATLPVTRSEFNVARWNFWTVFVCTRWIEDYLTSLTNSNQRFCACSLANNALMFTNRFWVMSTCSFVYTFLNLKEV